MIKARAQFEALQVSDCRKSQFFTLFRNMNGVSEKDQAMLQRKACDLIDHKILPAFASLSHYIFY